MLAKLRWCWGLAGRREAWNLYIELSNWVWTLIDHCWDWCVEHRVLQGSTFKLDNGSSLTFTTNQSYINSDRNLSSRQLSFSSLLVFFFGSFLLIFVLNNILYTMLRVVPRLMYVNYVFVFVVVFNVDGRYNV